MGLLDKLIGGGLKGLADGAKDIIHEINAPKEEKDKAAAALQELTVKHEELMLTQANEIEKAYLADTQSARTRETDFVKATGHFDYMMWALAAAGVGLLSYILWTLTHNTIPVENREMVASTKGTVEMIVVGIFSYYFGSSVGSRIKDMKGAK